MSDMDDRLKRLQEELDFLMKVKTQEDFDEGARLHAEKNAPWVSGAYADVVKKLPAYVFRAFPKMLYNENYEPACLEFDAACLIPARGSDEGVRDAAMKAAQRKKDMAVKTVANEAEEAAAKTRGWFNSPADAVAAGRAAQVERSVQAAHRAYDDRNMTEAAKAEIEAFDAQSDDFVAEMPEKKKAPQRTKVA